MIVWSQFGILGYLACPALGGLLAQHLGYAALALLPAITLAFLALINRKPRGIDPPRHLKANDHKA